MRGFPPAAAGAGAGAGGGGGAGAARGGGGSVVSLEPMHALAKEVVAAIREDRDCYGTESRR